jgi:hypothetical protein
MSLDGVDGAMDQVCAIMERTIERIRGSPSFLYEHVDVCAAKWRSYIPASNDLEKPAKWPASRNDLGKPDAATYPCWR